MVLKEIILQEAQRFKTFANNEDALLLKKIANIAPIMKQGGVPVDAASIAQSLGITPERAENLLKMGTTRGALDQTNTGDASGNDPLQRVLVDYYAARQVFEKNKTAKGKGTKTAVPKGGAANIAQRTGLSIDQIKDVVENRWDELVSKGQQLGFEIKPGFFALQDSALKQNKFVKGSGETEAQAIRRAIGELTDNFSSKHFGTLSGNAIEKHIGIDRRTVDKILSDDPSMKDLNKFRVRGISTGVTDTDRANAYHRTMAAQAARNQIS